MKRYKRLFEASETSLNALPRLVKLALRQTGIQPISAFESDFGYILRLGEVSLEKKQILDFINIVSDFRFIRTSNNGEDLDEKDLRRLLNKTGWINLEDGTIHI